MNVSRQTWALVLISLIVLLLNACESDSPPAPFDSPPAPFDSCRVHNLTQDTFHSAIQEAINSARDGDVLQADPCIYYENIDFSGKNVTLQSIDPDDPMVVDATVIDGGGVGRVVTFESGETAAAVLSGFTIRNGVDIFGGGIGVFDNSHPTITRNALSNNRAINRGGGIFVSENSNLSPTTPRPIGWGTGREFIPPAGTSVAGNRFTENTHRDNQDNGAHVYYQKPLSQLCRVHNLTQDSIHGTLQDAINGSRDGNVLQADPCIYYENIDFSGKNVTLQSIDPDDPMVVDYTVIDGGGVGRVVTFESGETAAAELSGFTIRNGNYPFGGGIGVFYNSYPIISRNVISGNHADQGGGILVGYDSHPAILGNTIIDNQAHSHGAGIMVEHESFPDIYENFIFDNTAGENGGGISVEDYSNANIRWNTISRNTAKWGGGIHVNKRSFADIRNNDISENTVEKGGGGICVEDASHPDIIDNTITQNTTQDGGGGGIFVNDQSNPQISENIISQNTSGWDGGGIWAWESSPTITDNTIRENSSGSGGGIAVRHNNRSLIQGNLIEYNSARIVGGGVDIIINSYPEVLDNRIENNTAEWYGGGIGINWESNPIISRNQVSDNRSGLGGGMCVSGDSHPTVTENYFIANHAGRNGGGGGIVVFEYSRLHPKDPRPIGWGSGPHEFMPPAPSSVAGNFFAMNTQAPVDGTMPDYGQDVAFFLFY